MLFRSDRPFWKTAPFPEIKEEAFIHAAILMIAFLCLAYIIIFDIWPATHADIQYVLLAAYFKEAFTEGFLYPRWMPDLYGGYGYPTFCFYPPAFFFISLPFTLAFSPTTTALHLTLVFLFFAGGAGAYRLCKELSNRTTGFFCSFLFLLTPYLFVNLYIRGALGELTAMLLSPWPIYFMTLLHKKVEEGHGARAVMAGLALSLALVIMSHPATALFFVPVLCLASFYSGLGSDRMKSFFLRAALSVALGLALSSPYWWTVFQLKEEAYLVEKAVGDYFMAYQHTVYPFQLISPFWGWGVSEPGSSDDTMSFQLGLVHLLLATVGAFYGRAVRLIRVAYVLYIALILFMTPLAEIFWKHLSLLHLVQFPWRILSVTAVLQVLCMAGLKNLLGRMMHSEKKAILLVLLGCSPVLWYSYQFQVFAEVPVDVPAFKTAMRMTYNPLSGGEFLPKTAPEFASIPPRELTPILQSEALNEPLEGSSSYRIRYRVINTSPATVKINQLYFPGWAVFVDGRRIARAELEARLTPDGLMQVMLPSPGRHTIEAYYEGPPGWRLRNLIISLFVLAFVGFWYYDRKRPTRPP